MLTKIGDVTNKFGISHRSLHYWESVGILQSIRQDNEYRYYDQENLQRIKQIMLLRKLRLSIPYIQEIFTSNELSKVISEFTSHLDESKKEKEQLSALGIILQQLINMLKDKQNIESVYKYLDTTHNTESDELKSALQTVFSEPVKEISIPELQSPAVDMTGVDLSLELMTDENIALATDIIKGCFSKTKETDKLLHYFNLTEETHMPNCSYLYKIIQAEQFIGVVTLEYIGRDAMHIRNIAIPDSDMNIYLFELLKLKHPEVLCWTIRSAPDNIEHFNYDFEGKKQQFWEDNGFTFYTNVPYNSFIKMLVPHDELYNSSKYRFALLDGSMDNITFRFFGVKGMDCYDGIMTNCRLTDVNFGEAIIYDTFMGKSKIYSTGIGDSDFRFSSFERSNFTNVSFEDCTFANCNLKGLTIDGINVENALRKYKDRA